MLGRLCDACLDADNRVIFDSPQMGQAFQKGGQDTDGTVSTVVGNDGDLAKIF